MPFVSLVRRPLLSTVLSLMLLGTSALAGAVAVRAAAGELFFSEYIEGSSNNKALEIYNGTGAPVALSGYSVQMFFNGNPSDGLTIDLTGTVASGDVFVVAQSSAAPAILAEADQTNGSGWFNGDDAVVLRNGSSTLDVIGQIGSDPGSQWGSGLTSTADNTLRRKAGIESGDTNGTDAFDPAIEWDGFDTNTFDGLGSHSSTPPASEPVEADCGPALVTRNGEADSATVTASDADGTVTELAITGVAPSPAPGSITRTSFTPAASDGATATAEITVDESTPPGEYDVTVRASNDDATPQADTCTLRVSVIGVIPIGQIQGPVGDDDEGTAHRSPLAPPSGTSGSSDKYSVQGVIYQRTLARTSSGADQNGFFIQNTAATDDEDPLTSDGIWVFMGSFSSLIGGYAPQVGDEVIIRGRVAEFFNLTQLSSVEIVEVVREGVSLDVAVPAFQTDPPDDLSDAGRYWERREGMRAQVPAGSMVQNGRNVFSGTEDGEVWVIRGDHPVAQRSDPYARRVFRDAHPLDNVPEQLFDDGNGYRILMGSLGVKAASGDNTTLIAPSRTFDTMANAPVGGVYFSFGKYLVQPEQQPIFISGADPSDNAPPGAFARDEEYSTAVYNVENLYDFRDDPNDGCDFVGNSGCPGVRPPFNYVPASEAAYEAQLDIIARQIVEDLHGPDIILVQEAEDQDICAVSSSTFACGTADDADGRPDTLQELALTIADIGGPAYDAAYDRDGADDRGIVSAFLYRTDRVQLLPAPAQDPVLGSDPEIDYREAGLPSNNDVQNPKALNAALPADVDTSTGRDGNLVFTRAPQVGLFRVWREGIGASVFTDVYAISNHFSSGPDRRVGQRTEQAAYNAAIVAALEASEANLRAVAGGDFNVFPRPDDPFAPGHPLFPSDQLAPLYELGLENLWDVLVAEVPSSAYSYVFQGQAQTLDQQFVTDALFVELESVRVAHINADWPAAFDGDGARGASDHDPMVGRFSGLPTIDRLIDLVAYFRATGDISDDTTAGQLLDRLERAEAFQDRGNERAADAQLQAFINQVNGKSPRFISSDAADVLVGETYLFRSQP